MNARTAPRTPEPPSREQVELRHGPHAVTVVEVGGGLRSYRLGTWEVLDGYGREEMCSAARGQCLIPWPNRLRGGTYRFGGERHQAPLSEPARHNAIHGFVRWANWTVAQWSEDCVLMRYVLHPRAGYPFALLLEVEYALSRDGLAVRTTATNVGAAPCPYGAGAHLYLTVGGPREDRLRQAPRPREVVDADGRPGHHHRRARRPRHGVRLPDTPTHRNHRARHRLCEPRAWLGRAGGRASRSRPRTTVAAWSCGWTRPTPTSCSSPATRSKTWLADEPGLGVEPMTCAPNAFQSGDGLQVLEPEETWTTTWGISPIAEHTT